MSRHFAPRAISRARWLDDLHQALADANLLLTAIAGEGRGGSSLDALRARILAMHAEVELLNVVNSHNNGCRIIGSAWPMVEGASALPN
jgi:hypothetical protein